MESAKGALLPNAPEARPTLEVAARLGVPIFLHPVPQPDLKKFFVATGQFNERFSRGSINAAALLAMMEAGIFEELPGLRVVATALSLGGLMLGECFGGGAKLGRDFAAQRQIYLDTTGLHPVMLRAALDLLGADRLVFGTDWPVVQEPGLAVKLTRLLTDCGLTATQQQAVAGGTALRLMGVQQLH